MKVVFQHRALTPSGEHGTFYFAYGSNLSPTQMKLRCTSTPDRSSRPLAIARLPGWRWYIDQRGCANISKTNTENDEVWGTIYDMSVEDEKTLDAYEGVDWSAPLATEDGLGTNVVRPTEQGIGRHNKVYVKVEVVHWRDESWRERLWQNDKQFMALAYPDEYRKEPGMIRPNYIGRMNRAIQEAVALGLSQEWIAKVVRPSVPEGIEAPEGYVGEKDKPLLV
ncbi:hypothetical protein DM02DRAFT_601767 [Periconia macrospinosa]|uniref:gamma-glutamylcyclotransferase n=1 Tax=Periconia macrospinosa TaxID=97972 RepID=A0A2V1D9Y2_9PLEO|nr:hypothetical protein DM02DRAFT_601767 [Periconia macrospinosa]